MTEQRRRILLVDDYPDALETWGLFLRMRGFDVITAADGQAAIDLADTTRPDAIVMDLELPRLSGYDAARHLRRNPETARIPLIAATGHSYSREHERARDAGFDVILIKPCDPDALVKEIERLLAGASQ